MANEQSIENLKKLKSFHNGSYGSDIDRAIKALEQEPKTGHWIEDTNGTYTDNHDTWECSECGHAQILLEGTPKDNDYNYCPNCGCRMKGEIE